MHYRCGLYRNVTNVFLMLTANFFFYVLNVLFLVLCLPSTFLNLSIKCKCMSDDKILFFKLKHSSQLLVVFLLIFPRAFLGNKPQLHHWNASLHFNKAKVSSSCLLFLSGAKILFLSGQHLCIFSISKWLMTNVKWPFLGPALRKYNSAALGDYSGWRYVVSGSRHPVQDLEPRHVSSISPRPERFNQDDGTECFDPQPGQEDRQRDPNWASQIGRIPRGEITLERLSAGFSLYHVELTSFLALYRWT